MYSHITLGTDDLEAARRFYVPVMAALGIEQPFDMPGTLVFGDVKGPKLFILRPFSQYHLKLRCSEH